METLRYTSKRAIKRLRKRRKEVNGTLRQRRKNGQKDT